MATDAPISRGYHPWVLSEAKVFIIRSVKIREIRGK